MSIEGTSFVRFVPALVIIASLVAGCGKREPSYKDRIGSIDPATLPNDLPPPPPAK
jgi:hypothetical protein